MYHQINPTETFRERELALLAEAHNRRLTRRLRGETQLKGGLAFRPGRPRSYPWQGWRRRPLRWRRC
jgi:hypothetical protein